MGKLPILATSIDFCTVCPDSPPINFEDRDEDKEPLTVYGMNGSYQVCLICLDGPQPADHLHRTRSHQKTP